jgi:hypothetical protein
VVDLYVFLALYLLKTKTSSTERTLKLIVELDRYPHGEYHIIEEDEYRDKYLGILGFTVLRDKSICIPGT